MAKRNCTISKNIVLQVAESDPGERWGTADFAPVEDTAGTKSVSSHNWGDGTKEELANRMQVSVMSDITD
jgi:hypothetical protein